MPCQHHPLPRPLLAALLLTAAVGAQAAVCRVTPGGAAGHDGSTWDNANAMTLQAALGASACTEIWVAQGVYTPTTDADRTVSFNLAPGVAVYGGFAGVSTEVSRDARNPATHRTVLSGDIDGDDTDVRDANGVDTAVSAHNGGNSYHVVLLGGRGDTGSGTFTSATVLDGVTITAGNANAMSSTDFMGGGLYCNGAGAGASCSPALANVSFSGNNAGRAANPGDPFDLGATGYGGAMYNDGTRGNSSPSLTNVSFSGNSASANGGAMYNFGSLGTSSPTLTNVSFSGNSASGSGGAMYNEGGSGNSSPSLTNVTFSDNSAGILGGAMLNNGAPFGTSSPTLTNVTFSGNRAGLLGGAMLNNGTSGGTARPTLTNVILVDDTAVSGSPEIHNYSTTATLSHSLVYNTAAASGACPTGNTCGSGMVYADPKLGALQDNGGATPTMLPAAGSAAIDTGTCTGAPTTDQRGVARPQGNTCDIGAVERRQGSLVLSVGITGTGTVSGGAGACAATSSNCTASYDAEGAAIVVLAATPGTGSTFSGWGGDCSGTGNCTVTMDQARSVTALFTLDTYAVTGTVDPASPPNSGTLDCTSPADYGTTTTCTAHPAAGHTTQSISGCGGTATGPGIDTFTTGQVTGACTVTALFQPNTYAIGGSISGLTSTGLVLRNGGEDLPIGADGAFAFVSRVPYGGSYAVTVQAQPRGQRCTVSQGSGSGVGADVTNVQVDCSGLPAPAPVPTLGPWALALLAGALGWLAWRRARRP